MNERLMKDIPQCKVIGHIKSTDEERQRYDEEFEEILKEAGVLKENESIKDFKQVDERSSRASGGDPRRNR